MTPDASVDRDWPDGPCWRKPCRSSNQTLGTNLSVVGDQPALPRAVLSGLVSSDMLAAGYSVRGFVRALHADFSAVQSTTDAVLEGGQALQAVYQSLPGDVRIEHGFQATGPGARRGNALGSMVIAAVPAHFQRIENPVVVSGPVIGSISAMSGFNSR